MQKEDLCYMYDSVWSGTCNDFKPYYEDSDPKMSKDSILAICRYAFEYYLKWNPDAVERYLTPEVLCKMKLYNLVMRVFPFPEELSEDGRMKYLVGEMYPGYYKFDKREATEETYQKMIEEEMDMPKGFFNSTDAGKSRAKTCFLYMINHYMVFENPKQIFEFFTTPEGRKCVAKYRLKQNVHSFGTMADYIFESLNEYGMTAEEYEACMFYREKYKSKHYMERYIRKQKKLAREERKKQKLEEKK